MGATNLQFVIRERHFAPLRDGVEFIGTIGTDSFTFIATREALQAAAGMGNLPADNELLAIYDANESAIHASALKVWSHTDRTPGGIYLVTDADIEVPSR